MPTPSALIVDKDIGLCRWLERTFTSWSMRVKNIINPLAVLDDVKQHAYDVILLDVCIPDVLGTELLGNIGELCPKTKIISMIDEADTSLIIKAIKEGAFDFLEKPISLELLRHVVMRAIDTQRMESEHQELRAELARNHQTLTEISEALSAMTKVVETVRRVTQTRMVQQIKSLILPLVEDLSHDRQPQIYEPYLAHLICVLDDIQEGFATTLQATTSLSARELRTALMIKHGMTNQEIASYLHLALETVKAHRRNIRKKLGITGTKCTLSAYLQALDDDAALSPSP